MKQFLLIITVMAVVISTSAQEDDKPPHIFRPARFEREFQAAMREENIEGMMVLMMEKGEVVYLESLGENPPDLEATYPIGRLADTFIVTTLMMLVEREQVNVHTPVINYLPGFASSNTITVRQLLNHTAGLGTAILEPLDTIPPEDITDDVLTFFPGERYSYCTRCYGLLVYLIGQLNGKPYDQLLTETIFYPLHMDNTRVENGQIITTIQDMTHWLGMLLQGGRWDAVQLMKPDSIHTMLNTAFAAGRSQHEYAGYGWLVRRNLGLGVREPDDDIMATVYDFGEFRAQITLIPHLHKGILLLTDKPTSTTEPLMQIAVKHFMGWTPPDYEIPFALAGFTGTFRTDDETELIIEETDDGLEITYRGRTAPLEMVDSRQFEFEIRGQRGSIYFDSGGGGSVFTLSIDGVTWVFARYG